LDANISPLAGKASCHLVHEFSKLWFILCFIVILTMQAYERMYTLLLQFSKSGLI